MSSLRSYISKLNDRNLQRKRESGITTYALYSVLIIIIFQIINLYPLIQIKSRIPEVIEISCYAINIFFFSLLSIGIYNSTNNFNSPLRIVVSKKSKFFFEQFFHYLQLLIPILMTAFLLKKDISKSNNYDWLKILIIILYILFVILITSAFFKKNRNSINIFDGTGTKESDNDFGSIFSYILCFIIVINCSYRIFISPIRGKLNIFVFSIIIYSLFIILDKIFNLKKTDNFTFALENLEYEINLKDLDDSLIREKLQNNYMGYLLGDWIIYNSQLIDDFNNDIENQKWTIEQLNINLQTIDKIQNKKKYDFQVKLIKLKKAKILKDINNFFNQKINDVERIMNNSTIDKKETDELYKLYSKLNKEFSRNKKNCH